MNKFVKDKNVSKSKSTMPLFQLANITPHDNRINVTKLKSFYERHKQFPMIYRPLVWRYLLKLPENSTSFADLGARGLHPAFQNLKIKFPLQSDRLLSKLQSICSILAHWSPIFGEVNKRINTLHKIICLFA
jgi:hypothetical protein